MPSYHYKARNRRGEAVTGCIDADSPELVAEQLFHSGITPVDITLAEGKGQPGLPFLARLWRPRVQLDELIMLCRQFYTLMHAGVPILRGLNSLVETTRNPTLATTLKDVGDDLQAGRDLASSLSRHGKVFSPLFVSIIRVGENTGRLDQAFAQLAAYLELEKETRDRIRAAMRYPMMVFATILLAMTVINIWVIPAFANAFSRFQADLPWATRWLIAISDFTVNWWEILLLVLVAGFFGLRFWRQTPNGDYIWSRFLLRWPLVGSIILRSILARFARSIAISIRSGVPLVQGLTVIAGVVNNAYVAERVLSMRDGIENGETIARTAAATGLFTPLVLQMIAIGEETGAVDDLLQETADHYDREVKYELTRLNEAIEPVVIIIIGVMVLILALGVFLPMWDLAAAARRG